MLSGLVVVAALALGTRALHLDGLADTVDGLGSGRDRERALEIMRRGDVGPMGVVALVLVVGAQSVAASALLTPRWADTVLLALVIAGSRASLLIGCRIGVPAARSDGLGATVAGSVRTPAALLVGALVVIMIMTLVVLAGRPWWAGVLALGSALLVAYGMIAIAVRRFGGVTGDVLGATAELTLTALLLGVTIG